MTEKTLIIRQDAGELQSYNAITSDLFARFVEHVDAKPSTIKTYTRALKQFFLYLQRNGITNPAYTDIKAYRDALTATEKPNTVQLYIITVRRFFEWTASEGLYPNVAGKIKGAKIDNNFKKDPLTVKQAKTVLGNMEKETLTGKRNFAIVALMVTGGLRDIEVSRANIEDLGTDGENTVLYLQGKGRDEKTEYSIITEPVERAIREYLKARGKTEAAEPLFVSESHNSAGGRLSTRSISSICKKAMQGAGYDSARLTAHSLRHTAITIMLRNNGGNIQEAQQFARHSNPATTEIYAHNLERKNNRGSRLVTAELF